MSLAVFDASAALAMLLPSQSTEAARALADRAESFAFVAPFVFEWEVQNVLLKALGRRRAAAPSYRAALEGLVVLNVALRAPTPVSEVIELARDDGLSLFDASYLALALEEGRPLISRDAPLIAAAAARDVSTIDIGGPA